MFNKYTAWFHRRATPQSEPIPGSTQEPNRAGGYAWVVTDWERLDRFLILGAEEGAYYVGARDLAVANFEVLRRCLAADGARTVTRIVEVSESGRAPKNDPAIFALAVAAACGSDNVRALALASLAKVCRTGTHLFHFAEYSQALRGWGRGVRRAVGHWYRNRFADDLAYQVLKYQRRDGWSHRDLLRLAHPAPATREQGAVFRWILRGADELGERTVVRRLLGRALGANPRPEAASTASPRTEFRSATYPEVGALPRLLQAFERAKRSESRDEIVRLIEEHDLPREAVPTQWLNEPPVWEALLRRMPLTAMVRNLGKMTAIGLLAPGTAAVRAVTERLRDGRALRGARLHPLALLVALRTYVHGHGEKGSLRWVPVDAIVDALDEAFYAAFANVVPVGKPMLLALDISGSMVGSMLAGTSVSASEASAAMALVTVATEPGAQVVVFTASGQGYGGKWGGGDPGLTPLVITPRTNRAELLQQLSRLPMGGTDCSLPIRWALRERRAFGGFVVYTDNETWAGPVHPAQALREYRKALVPDARLVVVGMTSDAFSIADPQDAGMLDVVGFDTAAPAVIADFLRGPG